MTFTPNIGLVVVLLLFLLCIIGMLWKRALLDFVKANFGLFVLVFLFMSLLGVSFHVFHEASSNTLSKDFLAWLEQKAGEVLASVMTVIVGARATNNRAGDNGNGTVNGTSSAMTSTPTKTSTSGDPHP